MFEAISWTEYLLSMGGALVLYYGWWAVKYAASLGWRLPRAKDSQADGRLVAFYMKQEEKGTKAPSERTEAEKPDTEAAKPVKEGAAPVEDNAGQVQSSSMKVPDAAAKSVVAAKTVVEAKTVVVERSEQHPVPATTAAGNPALFLSAVSVTLLKEVEGLAEKAAAEKMAEPELVFALQRLLAETPYCRLRGTAFQEKMTDHIVRVLEKLGSIRL